MFPELAALHFSGIHELYTMQMLFYAKLFSTTQLDQFQIVMSYQHEDI
jgi:hypothetical protein